ncbi:MAG: biotin carboxylase [Actinobacteria bacterium 13_2_20CM_2_71_6]|nr:MAG: biotin carboxylase [Actinobacteria bacterium 13_2_20CM_2_71_6]
MSAQKNVVIVDAYTPTRRLAPEFHKAGYQVVRVQSTPEPPLVYQTNFDLSPYAANIVHTGDLDATVRAVAAYEPAVVVAGGELGVELTDQISEAMGLLTNGTALSAARRDKYVQIEALRAAGLRATRQLLVTDAEQLAQWHRDLGGRVVVKPIRSAAGDGVSFCATPEESVAGYRAALGAENIFSTRNEAVVAQEYLVGPEYIVDTVSRDGQHHVTDIWKYEKITANGILDLTTGIRLLPRYGEAQLAVVPYAFEVLDALGISHGAAHLEIKLTPDGPCLVEAGARMAGLDIPFYSQQSIGEAQLEWIVDAYVRPERFAARWKDDYQLQRHFVSAMTVSAVDAKLRSYPLLPVVERLESLYDIRPIVAPGGTLRPTVDDMTCPLVINLTHPVEEVVVRDFGTIRYLDGPAFYELAEEA